MLARIKDQLTRLKVMDVHVELNDEFEPDAGTLVRVSHEGAYWHMLPGDLVELLAQLPDGARSEAVKQAIESKAQFLWHGPSPKGSRSTSP